MTHIAIGWDTQHRTAAWSASSARSSLPASNLGLDSLGYVWQTLDGVDSASIVADVGLSLPIGFAALLDFAGTASATFRFRVSDSDATGAAGEVYDSGTVGGFEPLWRHWVHLLPAEVSGRYRRLDVTQTGAAWLQAASMPMGPVWYPAHNVEIGVTWSVETEDQRSATRGGTEYIDEGPMRRVLSARLPAATMAEHDSQLLPLARLINTRRPILMVRDPAAASLGPEAVWGRVRTPLGFPNVFHQHYGWAFEVQEMLA